MADRMGYAVAYAASHRQLYLAASGTDRRHLGAKGVGVGGLGLKVYI